VSRIPGKPITSPTDVEVGSVLVEGHNGVRYRVTGIESNPHNWAFNVLSLTPIDNPVPKPCEKSKNVSGRYPIPLALSHVLGFPEDMLEEDWRPTAAWLLLTDPDLIDLPTGEYAHRIGVESAGIEWLPYQPVVVELYAGEAPDSIGTELTAGHVLNGISYAWLAEQGWGEDGNEHLWVNLVRPGTVAPNNRPIAEYDGVLLVGVLDD